MNSDPRLERYLTSLEQALKPFPVSDRAEIITEIKSHVLSALERDPQSHLDSILSALGEPETVANRYLLERGMKPAKTSISPIVKWLVIGFLCTFAMILIFIAFVVAHSSSLVKIDGQKGKIELLGGMIDIDGDHKRVSITGTDDKGSEFAGVGTVKAGQGIGIKFKTGKVEFVNSDGKDFGWSCSADGPPVKDLSTDSSGNAVLDLTTLKKIKCKFGIPAGVHVSVDGAEGKMDFDAPQFDLAANLDTGKVTFHPDGDDAYKYDMSVTTGKIDEFESSDKPGAHSIKIHVTTGKIEN
jgi:hypothetical protein